MTTTKIEVGYNVRNWITFTLADATQEEREILANDSEESIALAAKLEAEGRLIEENSSTDDNPTIWSVDVECSIIDVIEEGDEQ